MKRPGKMVVIAAFLLFLLMCGAGILAAGKWLKGGDEPAKADAAVILAGPFARSLYAADLYREGYVPRVYISRPIREHGLKLLDDLGVYMPRMEDIYKQILIKKGVPEKDISILGELALSTVDEAETINKTFRGENCKLLVITSPYHVKRTQMIFEKTVKNCRFSILSTPYEPFSEKWWTDQDSARNVILEISKVIFYRLGGRFKTKKRESISFYGYPA